MKKYLHVYFLILGLSLKNILEYRLNTFVRTLYTPIYAIMIYVVIQVVFSKTSTLGGWTRDEAGLLFFVFYSLYGSLLFFFYGGVRDFVEQGVNTGTLDLILTKPMNTQFLVTFGKPDLDALLLLICASGFTIYQAWLVKAEITFIHFLLFLVSCFFGWMIGYLVITTYAALTFYVTKTRQVIMFIDKATDFAVYPFSIFPASIQGIVFTVLPIAFFSYVPTSFLLGKGSVWFFPVMIVVLVVFAGVNKVSWEKGLKHYSSASS